MPISRNFTSIYAKDWDINFLQCYPNGYLKYTELCNILQLTAGLHAESGGLSFTDMQVHNQAWVLSRMRVEIVGLPKWGDKVRVKTWIVELKGARSIRALALYVGKTKIVSAQTYWVVLNTKLRKSENLALPFDHFEMFPDISPTEKGFAKINMNQEIEVKAQKSVLLSDLDVVNHANNVKYLEWCLDYAPIRPILGQKIKAIDVNFLLELHINDAIEIVASPEEFPKFFAVRKNKKNCFGLEIEWK